MNKKLNFGLSIFVALFLVFGAATPVFAQAPTPAAGGTNTTQNPGWFESIAQALQMGITDLQTALKQGRTIAQLALEKGVNLNSLVTTLTARLSSRLQQAVSNGKLTQGQADQKLNTLQSDLNNWFTTGTMPAGIKMLGALRQADKTIADALGMTVNDFNAALKSGKTVAQLAQEKGVSLDTLVNAVTAKRTQQLQKAVQDVKLTQEQADKALNALKTGVTQWFQTGKMPPTWKLAKTLQNDRNILAKDLGMTPQELDNALKSGQTITQLAQEKGVSLDKLVGDIAAQRAQQLQKAVQAGKITQDQANQNLENFKKNLTNRLQNGRRHHKPGVQSTPQSGTQQPDLSSGA